MRTYTRARIPGGCYFFTVNLASRQNNDLLVRHIANLREAFRRIRAEHPFAIDGIVILPDHLHCIWQLPDGDSDFPMRWRLIKARFSQSLPAGERITDSRARKGERGIWQRRYWEHVIRDDHDHRAHMDYIHFNPVRHGHVTAVRDWPYSSFHRCVRAGMYPVDWGTACADADIGAEGMAMMLGLHPSLPRYLLAADMHILAHIQDFDVQPVGWVANPALQPDCSRRLGCNPSIPPRRPKPGLHPSLHSKSIQPLAKPQDRQRHHHQGEGQQGQHVRP